VSWYPGALKLELQPESDGQPRISPTQFILHSIAAPWDERRIGAYWDEPNIRVESHFGLDFDGSLGQYIGTQTRADANAGANLRSDGTGAVSLESASNLKHTDEWTSAQIRVIIDLGVWLHRTHGIPLRICRSHSDPGFGYHSLFPQWSTGGTACPGAARIRQFRDIVFPGIVRAAQGATGPTTPPPTNPPAEGSSVSSYYGPAFLPPNTVLDDSAITIPLPAVACEVLVAVNYVWRDGGGTMRIRLDEINANGTVRQQNVVWSLANGQWSALPCLGPGSIAIQRLDHPKAQVSAIVKVV
jgi:hypothetical protein